MTNTPTPARPRTAQEVQNSLGAGIDQAEFIRGMFFHLEERIERKRDGHRAANNTISGIPNYLNGGLVLVTLAVAPFSGQRWPLVVVVTMAVISTLLARFTEQTLKPNTKGMVKRTSQQYLLEAALVASGTLTLDDLKEKGDELERLDEVTEGKNKGIRKSLSWTTYTMALLCLGVTLVLAFVHSSTT